MRLAVLAAFIGLVALSGCGAIGEGRHRVEGAHVPGPADWWLNPVQCTGASIPCSIR